MATVPEMFGCHVFNEKVMQERLPKDTYKLMKKSFQDGKRMSLEVATVVANAMKDWAIENGATHYTHWFQPMTSVNASSSTDTPITGSRSTRQCRKRATRKVMHTIAITPTP